MYEIYDQGILFILGCLLFYQSLTSDLTQIIFLLIASMITCLYIYFDHKWTRFYIFLGTIVLVLFLPKLIYFIPVFIYYPIRSSYRYVGFLNIIAIIRTNNAISVSNIILLLIFCVLSIYLSIRTERTLHMKEDYTSIQDTSRELYLAQVEKNQHMLENQDYEINLATLNERNRISKEIHDNIGHLLSRSLLQIGALLMITKDDTTKEVLTDLKDSISSGMDDIRTSIHNMHDESIDLYTELYTLVKEFTFCHINFEYDLSEQPELKLRYCFISTLKESLANIVKHSKATDVYVILREHPAFYQFIIDDNGELTQTDKTRIRRQLHHTNSNEGMGLHNIIDRVTGFHGTISFNLDHGFQTFITIPKEQ
mgnify:CR=1 FL=1